MTVWRLLRWVSASVVSSFKGVVMRPPAGMVRDRCTIPVGV